MKATALICPTQKDVPADTHSISHQLMLRAGLIHAVAAGVYSYLPLGLRVIRHLEQLIRRHLDTLAQEVLLPVLIPEALWQQSGRWDKYGPELFRIADRHEAGFCLGPTHEEAICQLARFAIRSYKQLPVTLYQIQTKFRDEIRPRAGLMRGREFIMKDAYSFHATQACLDNTYTRMQALYSTIFSECDLPVRCVSADAGTIGGDESAEFITDTDQALELGHIFKLGTLYSDKLQASITTESGQNQPVIMGCYGIGVGRLMAAIIETHHDDAGIIWPDKIAPYNYVIIITNMKDAALVSAGMDLYQFLCDSTSVVIDDRAVSAGVKFKDASLIGYPVQLIFGSQYTQTQKIEKRCRRTGAVSYETRDTLGL